MCTFGIGDVLILILFLLNFYNFYDDYTRNIAVKKKTHTTNILIDRKSVV